MIVVTGGAWQGKLDFVMKEFRCSGDDIYRCGDSSEADFSRKVIACGQLQIRNALDDGITPEEIRRYWIENAGKDSILIFDDVNMGVVPADRRERIFRETCGRTVTELCRNADRVYRVFCGIPMELKNREKVEK